MPPLQLGTDELRFVSVTNPAQNTDAAQRRTIRKHVMRRFWGQIKGGYQPQEDIRQSGPSLTSESGSYLTLRACTCQELSYVVNESALGPCPVCRNTTLSSSEVHEISGKGEVMQTGNTVAATSSPYMRIGLETRDPFQSLPIAAEPQTEFMIQHWIANLSPSIATLEVTTNRTNQLNPVASLVQTIISDPAMLHGLIAFSSSLMDARSGRQMPGTTTLFHLGHAIRLLNNAICDPKFAISDQVLTTICLVAAHHAIFGDFKNHQRHADGLYQVIKMRGGVRSLACDRLLYGMVTWIDQFRGLYSNSPPRYLLPAPTSHRLKKADPIDARGNKSAFDCGGLLSNECIDMMEMLSRLMPIIESCKSAPVSSSDRKAFYDERGWIENRMIFLIAESSDDNSKAYERCVYLAASLFHHTVPRPLCIWSGVHATPLERLKIALLRTNLDNFWQPYSRLLLWILMTAIPASIDGPTKLWFLELLRGLLFSCFPNWTIVEMKEILRYFLWHDRICGPACEGVLRRVN